jgi:CBS domain containing-hemolysin-like protein
MMGAMPPPLKAKLVKDLMVPLSEYATVSEDATLSDAVAALKQSHADFDRTNTVTGQSWSYADQQVVGKVNFHAILKALEPKYDEMFSDTVPCTWALPANTRGPSSNP